MSWVTIDQEKCNTCGICAIRCIRCFTLEDKAISVYADQRNCNLCGHCVALCPTGAVIHHKMNMDGFIEFEDKIRVKPNDFIALVKRRRSHRHFKEKAIPREDLETLVDMCRYLPTGSNNQSVEIIVLQNPEKIKELSDLTVDYFQNLIQEIEEQAERVKSEGKEIPEDLQQLLITAAFRKHMVLARESGRDPIFYKAPAVMIFHSQEQPSTPKDDCVIAAQTVTLAAMTMGLESCYIGLFEKASVNYPPIGQALALPADHTVYSVLILGYPKLRFLRTIERRPIKTRWE